ncbi:hypothetical protein HY413_00565 [Candidatus Kaiserbacteria bacterium]|nr:hypothetical protein [Candidatus Kaiserbacteria bacterium]
MSKFSAGSSNRNSRGGGRYSRKSTDGVWRSRAFSYPQTDRHNERLAVRLRRVRIVSLGVGAFFGLFTVCSIAVASHLERFRIADVRIEGQVALSAEAIRVIAESSLKDGRMHLLSPDSIFFFPRTQLSHDVRAQFPRIKSVVATVGSFADRSITVAVTERMPFAHWCRNEACFLLDDQGFAFATSTGAHTTRSEIFRRGLLDDPIGQRFLPSYFHSVITMLSGVERLGLKATDVEVMNENEYHVTLKNGTVLMIRFVDDPQTITENLRAALSTGALMNRMNDVMYIDLRFDGRVYYKYKL